MHSTGCEADQGVHQGGQDEARQHGGGAGHHGVRLFQGASSIALSEHDYVMADIKKEVTDWEEDGSHEARKEEDEDTEEEGEEDEDIDGYEEEEEQEEEGKERWFNLSQLAEVTHPHHQRVFLRRDFLTQYLSFSAMKPTVSYHSRNLYWNSITVQQAGNFSQ